MFSIALASSANIGDIVDCRVNGIEKRIEIRADSLYVLPNAAPGAMLATGTERRIGVRSPAGRLAMRGGGTEECTNYWCESDDGFVPRRDSLAIVTTA